MTEAGINVLIAGGKTGGHLFPGIAVAKALEKKGAGRVLFVGTGGEFETETLERYGFAHTSVSAVGIKGRGLLGKLKAAFRVPLSMIQTIGILFRFRPDIVLGVGGYSSGPVVLTARMLGIKTAIQEQNSIPGMTNRILARYVHLIFTSFEKTQGFEDNPKVVFTGNPVRRSEAVEPGPSSERNEGLFTLLVTGGSQGAASINRAVLEAVNLMERPEGIRIIHQTGTRDEAFVNEHYISLGIPATAKAFFHNMPTLLAGADLVICRAGAGTLSELTCLGKPSILIPYPFAADDHQRYNAQAMVDNNAAWMIPDRDISGEILMQYIEAARKDPGRLAAMGKAALRMGRPEADMAIAEKCLELAGRKEG